MKLFEVDKNSQTETLLDLIPGVYTVEISLDMFRRTQVTVTAANVDEALGRGERLAQRHYGPEALSVRAQLSF